MNLRVEIQSTEPTAPEGTYVFDSGPLEGQDVGAELHALNKWILHALAEMRRLKVKS